MQLTTKELALLQDNIKNLEASAHFFMSCANETDDPKLTEVFNDIVKSYANDVKTLAKYISDPNLQ